MSTCQLEENVDSYQSAVAIARQAFAYVSTYRTPPVPEIYSVWYRYAEGKQSPICELLSKRVKDESVCVSELLMLHEQQKDNSLEATSHDISFRIGEELERIRGILQGQQEASADFSGSIAEANDCLNKTSSRATTFRTTYH